MSKNVSDIDFKIETALEKLLQVQRVLLWDVAKKEGLSPIQIQFLLFINTTIEDNRNVSVLAKEFDLTKATVSDAISSLEKKSLLKKYQKAEDKRSYLLELTNDGKKMIERINSWQSVLVEHISAFPEEQKENVLSFLMNIIKSLFNTNVINVARMCLTCANYENQNDNKHYCKLTSKYFEDKDVNFSCDYYQLSK